MGPVGDSNARVSYAYGYDPEGNMMKLKHIPSMLIRMAIGTKWAKQNPIWMTQVALISPDVERLADYYNEVLEIESYRDISHGPHPFGDAIVDLDNVTFRGIWFDKSNVENYSLGGQLLLKSLTNFCYITVKLNGVCFGESPLLIFLMLI